MILRFSAFAFMRTRAYALDRKIVSDHRRLSVLHLYGKGGHAIRRMSDDLHYSCCADTLLRPCTYAPIRLVA